MKPRLVSTLLLLLFFLFFAAAAPALAALPAKPSRPAAKGCAWETVEDPAVGLAAWVQRCDYGYRKIDLFLKGASLFVRYSDGGEPEPLVDVFGLREGEKPEEGIRRVFTGRTDPKVARRCVLAPYRGTPHRAAALRFTFVPDAAYAKEIEKTADPNEVGEPPCGELGEAPDGIQYFEAQPKSGAHRFLFVRSGQDEPLFDENTLTLLPP